MKFFYRVKRQHPERFKEPCEVLAQGRGGKGAPKNRLIRFRDGFTMVVPFFAVRVRRRA